MNKRYLVKRYAKGGGCIEVTGFNNKAEAEGLAISISLFSEDRAVIYDQAIGMNLAGPWEVE